MVMRLRGTSVGMQAGLLLAAAGLLLAEQPIALAQDASPFMQAPSHPKKPHQLPGRLPDKPSQSPAFTIPVGPLGFSPPGPLYLGLRNALVSLDFLDEDHLLFTFRVPGLMRREAENGAGGDERQIRAVTLALPAGTVVSEALWTVHDRARYLWMLKDGHFLLRDRNGLAQGDVTLELKPLFEFPGALLWLELDPTGQYLVTNSREPVAAPVKAGLVPSPESASAALVVDGQQPLSEPDLPLTDLVVRILRRASGQVLLVSRTRSTVHLPINAEGYLESLRGNGEQWLLNLKYFTGGSKILGRLASACSPAFDFLSEREVLVTACIGGGGRELAAMDTSGRLLWEDLTSPEAIWPLIVRSPDGSRLAQETLAVTHEISATSPLDAGDVKGQLVRVIDAATGKVALEAMATPALDAGGNVAISPSGRRVAILSAGAIQLFDLPAPPPLADAQTGQTGR
jgi:hypothetical protein